MPMYDTEERINYASERGDYWIRFGNPKESSSHTGNQGGKYLFFCESQKALLDICRYEIENHGFEFAKVSTNARDKDYVCCLYWKDDSRKHELAERYKKRRDIKYRYWKSNKDTRAGKYSKKYNDNPMNFEIPDDQVSLICGGSIWDWQGF